MFKSKNKVGTENSKMIPLYVPESSNTDKYSRWRKKDYSHLDNPVVKERHLGVLKNILQYSSVLNLILCLIIFLGIINLIFFTNYDYTILDDGTYLNCIIDVNGVVQPLQTINK